MAYSLKPNVDSSRSARSRRPWVVRNRTLPASSCGASAGVVSPVFRLAIGVARETTAGRRRLSEGCSDRRVLASHNPSSRRSRTRRLAQSAARTLDFASVLRA